MAPSRFLDRWGELLFYAVGEEGRSRYRGGSSWWGEIDDSREWQDGIFFTLCAAYALVSLVALVQLFRIQIRVPEYGWTTQKVFHLMNFVVNGMRAILFGLHRSVFVVKPKVLEMALLDVPALIFSQHMHCLYYFGQKYITSVAIGMIISGKGLPIGGLRPAYLIINGFIYVLQVSIWIYVQLSQQAFAMEVAKLFFAVVSFFAALGFVIYGGRLFIMLRRFPIQSKGRRKKLNEVGLVTSICCTCFLIRCFVVALSAFDKEAEIDVLNHPILNLVYYMLVEILPSALVLFILRKLPPKRVSDGYHPIN